MVVAIGSTDTSAWLGAVSEGLGELNVNFFRLPPFPTSRQLIAYLKLDNLLATSGGHGSNLDWTSLSDQRTPHGLLVLVYFVK